jgi:hypothetical protein
MEPDIVSVISKLDLRVLIEFDRGYQAYVAHCIDTGAVATGDNAADAQAEIKQVLEQDLLIAIRDNSFKSLLHIAAPADVRERWYRTITADPKAIEKVKLDIPLDPPRRGVHTEFRVAKIGHSAA